MTQGRRVKLSAAQRADLWSRWKAGESLHEIGRALGKDHVVIHFLLARHGGIAPAARRRSLRTLTLAEREDISRGIASGSSVHDIANGLQRAASTVSREVARHGGRPQYRANDADQQAWESASGILVMWESSESQMTISRRNIKGRPFRVGFDCSHQRLQRGAPL